MQAKVWSIAVLKYRSRSGKLSQGTGMMQCQKMGISTAFPDSVAAKNWWDEWAFETADGTIRLISPPCIQTFRSAYLWPRKLGSFDVA